MESDNVVRLTPYSVEYSLDCGENGALERFLRCFDTKNAMFRFISKLYAFDDCYELRVHSILCDGAECRYIGWQPQMKYEYIDCETKKVVYFGYFPEYDH